MKLLVINETHGPGILARDAELGVIREPRAAYFTGADLGEGPSGSQYGSPGHKLFDPLVARNKIRAVVAERGTDRVICQLNSGEKTGYVDIIRQGSSHPLFAQALADGQALVNLCLEERPHAIWAWYQLTNRRANATLEQYRASFAAAAPLLDLCGAYNPPTRTAAASLPEMIEMMDVINEFRKPHQFLLPGINWCDSSSTAQLKSWVDMRNIVSAIADRADGVLWWGEVHYRVGRSFRWKNGAYLNNTTLDVTWRGMIEGLADKPSGGWARVLGLWGLFDAMRAAGDTILSGGAMSPQAQAFADALTDELLMMPVEMTREWLEA